MAFIPLLQSVLVCGGACWLVQLLGLEAPVLDDPRAEAWLLMAVAVFFWLVATGLVWLLVRSAFGGEVDAFRAITCAVMFPVFLWLASRVWSEALDDLAELDE